MYAKLSRRAPRQPTENASPPGNHIEHESSGLRRALQELTTPSREKSNLTRSTPAAALSPISDNKSRHLRRARAAAVDKFRQSRSKQGIIED